MIGQDNTYFHPNLCLDTHYIVTGHTNDRYCNDRLQLTDIRQELHNHLRQQNFDAIIFFDGVNMLYCYDRRSYEILRTGIGAPEERTPASSKVLQQDGPTGAGAGMHLGRRGQRRGTPAPEQAQPEPIRFDRLNMGMMSDTAAWQQVTAILTRTNYRCALVLNNPNSLQDSIGRGELQILEELSSYRNSNHSIVIYIFRDTTISNLLESSRENSNDSWNALFRTTLRPRIESDNADNNRVISLRTPNAAEVRNLLNHMRLQEEPIPVRMEEINELAQRLADACSRNDWGLVHLVQRMTDFHRQQPDAVISLENWRQVTGELDYRSPLERLDSMVGLEVVKEKIHAWYATTRSRHPHGADMPTLSSRFTAPNVERRSGHSLNVQLRGGSGTGKSTVARLIGELYHELGLLPQGHLVERNAGSLVSGNVGATAALIRDQVQEAMGGVLFIDEAYALMSNAHGQEAIDQLVAEMSRYEGQFAVVIAGYTRDIERLLTANEGLTRRFPTVYELPDYTASEIRQLVERAVELNHVALSPELQEALPNFCENWVNSRAHDWSNAGEAQNLVADMINRCNARLEQEGRLGEATVLTVADIPERLRGHLIQRSTNLEEALKGIDSMIGLTNVKDFLRQLYRNIRWDAEEKAPGNYIFYGPPGAGKTVTARRMGELLRLLGVLKRGHVIERTAAQLSSPTDDRGVSVTIQQGLEQAVDDARGGILFIDEAHQLANTAEGQQVIRQLVPLIENPEIHADTAFILAGYAKEMRYLLQVDPGLQRRFPLNHRIRFENYTARELVQILASMAEAQGETPLPEYLQRSTVALDRYLERVPANFGNGGFIRDTYLPDSIAARTRRLDRKYAEGGGIATEAQVNNSTPEERRQLTAMDIPDSFVSFAGPLGQPLPPERNAATRLSELYGKQEVLDYAAARRGAAGEQLFFDRNTTTGLHFAISGATGTGRHTVVHALAALWKELGLLERDEVHSVSEADLVAGYVGQTAPQTTDVIQEHMGGTLIIENPSSMLPQRSDGNSFGPEALGVIAGAMSSYTNEISIVLLDSKEGLERLYRAFPTMRSSISREFHLEELSPAEMEQVFRLKTRDSMVLEPELQDLFSDFMVNWVSDRGGQETAVRTWSNGVEVDRLVDSLAQNWKRLNGTVQSEEIPVEEDGQQRTYRLNRRLITREMVPQELQRYLKRSSAVSETAMEELNQLVGLRRVKEAVRGIERRIRRLGKGRVSPGLYCFLGNPGVGKTTVANLMGGILRATGALSQGHVISRTARQMCESVGEFAAIIKLAKNGILFIDEAHQLAENAYGNEVIKRLLTVLEDTEVTRNTCIILAGYPREMMRMLSMDSGLSSRFGTADSMIFFDDYIPEELMLIMQGMAAHANTIPQIGSLTPLRLTEEYRERSLEVFQRVCQQGDPNFGNARFVRNYLHDSLDELLRRLDETEAAGNTAEEDLLTGSDVPARYRGLLNRKISQVQLGARDLNTQRQERIRAEDYDEACDRLARSVVYLSVETVSGSTGSGTGTIISQNGYVLTCNHVAEGAKRIRARLYTPGMVGGNYHWFDCEVLRPSFKDCDMSILKLEGTGFPAAPIRPATEPVRRAEETLMIGYPLGEMLTRDNVEALNYSNFSGRVASIQPVGTRGVETCYVDTTGLHGNSGSPVFSREDGRMIGVFSGSIIPPGKKTLDEINYFYPIRYLWERFVELQTPQDGTEDDE